MSQLGLSIYPDYSNERDVLDYIDLGAQYGFTRVFTNLLGVTKNDKKYLKAFEKEVSYASEKGMKVVVDINSQVLKNLNLTYNDLSYFKDLGVSGVRLDAGFSALEGAEMTFNEQGLDIELSISVGNKYLDDILAHMPNQTTLLGCHNFYPQRYTGLSYDHFIKTSAQFKNKGIRTAAFVTSQNAKKGPWSVMEGLPTLESHRDLSLEVQAKHLLMSGVIDDIIIGNAFASDNELKRLAKLKRYIPTYNVHLNSEISQLEKEIALEEPHFNRGDVSDYVIRSTQSRVKYKGHSFPPYNTKDIEQGDIIILNNNYEHYAGEMQIALKKMKNNNARNVIGKIKEEELFLLNLLEPWEKFQLKKD